MNSCLLYRDMPHDIAPFFLIIVLLLALLFLLTFVIIKTWIWCRLFSRAGYCWALGLLMLVPIANIILPFVLAFADWPILKELRQLQQQLKTTL